MDTGPTLGRIVKRLPFTIENPAFGKPVAELPQTAMLRRKHPGATVVELFQDAPLRQLGIAAYDGVRDVYFGDGRGANFGGSCTNRGCDLSYGTDLRFQLHLGGEARRSLIRYDLAMLPPDARVARALLLLHTEEADAKAEHRYRVVALRKRWSETAAGVMGGLNATNSPTPRSRGRLYPVGETENWEEPLYRGASDRQPEPVAALENDATGWVSADLTGAVQKWVSGEWPNHGVAIEPTGGTLAYGRHDVRLTASDYPVDPALRPRLVLVLEGAPEPVEAKVREVRADLDAAMARAKEAGKPLLVHALSARSLTSRSFAARLLDGAPALREFIDARAVEARLDADRPDHAERLRAWGVRRVPSSVVLSPDGQRVALLEPFDFDAPLGLTRSAFEFVQLYSRAIAEPLRRATPAR